MYLVSRLDTFLFEMMQKRVGEGVVEERKTEKYDDWSWLHNAGEPLPPRKEEDEFKKEDRRKVDT